MFISDVVVAEISSGDAIAAQERLKVVDTLPRLTLDEPSRLLAIDYVRLLAIPPHSQADEFHLALSVLNEMDYLLTWNCRHIANPRVQRTISLENTKRGLHIPLLVTPEMLLEMEVNR